MEGLEEEQGGGYSCQVVRDVFGRTRLRRDGDAEPGVLPVGCDLQSMG